MIYSTPEFDVITGKRSSDYACMHVFYDVGMKDDVEFTCGIAHLSEHIIEMQCMSDGNHYVETNAFLNKEYTCFYSKCLIENSFEIFNTQSKLIDKALNSITNSVIEKEKKRILSENKKALKNNRLHNVLKLESMMFDNELGVSTIISPSLFLEISIEDVKQFISEKYLKKACIVYSGFKTDLDKFNRFSKKNVVCNNIPNKFYRCISYNTLFCISFKVLEDCQEFFQLKVLMEYYTYVWNINNKNKIISNSIKLFNNNVLIFFEFSIEAPKEFDKFLYSYEFKFECYFNFIYEKVLLDCLFKLENLATFNLFVYKAYRYFNESNICYKDIREIFSHINCSTMANYHKDFICKILQNSIGEYNEKND